MPVRFEKSSEYDRNYKWVDSYLSEDFQPSVDQMFPPAGMASVDIANLTEPKLQSRRKPVDLLRTSTTYQDSVPSHHDDYILVGDQSKFAPSVKYRVLGMGKENVTPTTTTPAEAKEHKDQGQSKHFSHEQTEQKPVGGESTKYYCKKHGKVHHRSSKMSALSLPVTHEDHDMQTNGVAENGYHPQPTAERSPPPAPRDRVIAPVPKRKPDNYMPRPTKPIVKSRPPPPPRKGPKAKPQVPKVANDLKESEPQVGHTKPSIKSYPPPPLQKESAVKPDVPKLKLKESEAEVAVQPQRKPADPREKRKGKFNEFVQTDLSKGVTHSEQEATADYAMKYRAGCPPPRPKGPKRLSEYQMQFQWKKGVGVSPLLAAEQIVYNSNPQVAPYSNPDLPPKVSEYNQAFKKYAYKPLPVETVQPKKPKLRRSKSMEAVTPDRLRAAGMRSGKCTEEDKRLLRESANPTHPLFPHGKIKNVGSEYAMNYLNPTRYSYEDGVWKGADPPHIQPDKTPVPVTAPHPKSAAAVEQPETSNSWYKEVLELRNKALEYKQRARGTHFSREHLAQLYAQQADLWDTVSNSSILSALSLESAGAMATKKPSPHDDATPSCSSHASSISRKAPPEPKAAPSKLAWDGEQASATQSKATSVASVQGSPPGSVSAGSDDTLEAESSSSQQGRLPTPKFRKEHDLAGYKWRHHLDRTTPAIGGALLTSPPQRRKTKTQSKSDTALYTATSAPKVRCTRKSDGSDSEGSDQSPTYRIHYPDPPHVNYPKDWSEHIQMIKTHTNNPVFHFLPERKMAHIKKSSNPMFRTTSRPVMVPQVAARLVDPYHQYGIEEKVVDEPHADGYVNPVYLGEGEIMQPSAVAYVSPDDARYALVPRYVPRTLPYPPDHDDDGNDSNTPSSKLKSALKGDGKRQVSASWAGQLATSGLPTRDTHVLVDEEASTDRPLSTKFTDSPPVGKPVRKHPLGVAVMPTLRETQREMQSNSSAGNVVDDDAVSLSARSVASTCSLASEVLERARNRRDEFWGNDTKKASRS